MTIWSYVWQPNRAGFWSVTISERCQDAWRRSLRTAAEAPGVLLVIPQNAPVADVVEAQLLIWADDRPDDWVNVVAKIPF